MTYLVVACRRRKQRPSWRAHGWRCRRTSGRRAGQSLRRPLAALPSLADDEKALGRRSSRTNLAASPAESCWAGVRRPMHQAQHFRGIMPMRENFYTLRPREPHMFLCGSQPHEHVSALSFCLARSCTISSPHKLFLMCVS